MAISISPKYTWPLNNKAIVLNDLELYEEAIELFMIEIDSTFMADYYNIKLYSALEDYENALQDHSKRIELDPNNAWNYKYRADCYQLIDDHENVLRDLSSAIELSSPESKGRFLNDRADYNKDFTKNYESSLADYEEVLKLPNAPEYQKARAIHNRALIYKIQGNHQQNLIEYKHIIDNYSHNLGEADKAKTYNNLADAYFPLRIMKMVNLLYHSNR